MGWNVLLQVAVSCILLCSCACVRARVNVYLYACCCIHLYACLFVHVNLPRCTFKWFFKRLQSGLHSSCYHQVTNWTLLTSRLVHEQEILSIASTSMLTCCEILGHININRIPFITNMDKREATVRKNVISVSSKHFCQTSSNVCWNIGSAKKKPRVWVWVWVWVFCDKHYFPSHYPAMHDSTNTAREGIYWLDGDSGNDDDDDDDDHDHHHYLVMGVTRRALMAEVEITSLWWRTCRLSDCEAQLPAMGAHVQGWWRSHRY